MLSNADVTLKLKNVSFFEETIDYLGHVICPVKLGIATRTTEPMKGLKRPTNIRELRSFFGLCNVLRRFVETFAKISTPLNKKLQKYQPFTFGARNDEDTASRRTLQEKLTSPPVFTLPEPTGRYIFNTNACDKQVVCVILQEQDVIVIDH